MHSRLGITFVVLYTLVVLGGALVASTWLYDWSRLRILGTSSLAELANLDFLTSGAWNKPEDQASEVVGEAAVEGGAVDESAQNQPAVTIPPINVLLLGTDARPGEGDISNTDTMILLHFDPQNQVAGLLSMPRDLWVPIPGFGYETRINTAYPLGETYNYAGGGAQLAKDTVSSFIGQQVHYYARVNFQGFVDLVDLIGGVDVVVPFTIYDTEYPTQDYGVQTFYLEAGPQHLDGETALKYVRTRNVDDDYGRAGRQQQVIRAVVDKVLRADMLPTLLPKLPQLLMTMRSSVDTDIPMATQLELANYLTGSSLQVRQLVLDNRYGEETYSEEGAWILRPDRARVLSALATFFAPPTATNGGSSGSAVAMGNLEWVRIEILNGTGEPGVAAHTRDLLQSQGYQVVSIGDADRSDYGRTLIINYGIPDELVERLGVDLELEPGLSSLQGLNVSAPVDVRIVVGRDYLPHLQQ
ncbi:MAG: LCP family protein [Caldilineaceae bacterium]|nr:LCP family protein [Caldilineaceae bacterium]